MCADMCADMCRHVCRQVCQHVCVDMHADRRGDICALVLARGLACVAEVFHFFFILGRNCSKVETQDPCATVGPRCHGWMMWHQLLGARRWRLLRTCVDLKVSKDASDRDISDATLRFDLALGVRRRRAPKSCHK